MSFQSPSAFDALRYPARRQLDALPNALRQSQGWGAEARQPAPAFDLAAQTLDESALDTLGADFCLLHRILPLRRIGGGSILACASPPDAGLLAPVQALGAVCFAQAPETAIKARLLAEASPNLTRRAEEKRPLATSCRGLRPVGLPILTAASVLLIALIWMFPQVAMNLAVSLAILGLLAATALKLLGLAALAKPTPSPPRLACTEPRLMPKITLLLPLLHEPRVAQCLVNAIEALEYPRFALEVLILVEADDHITKEALDEIQLARHFQVI